VFGVKSGANADYVIDRTYRLDEIVEAVRYVETGQKRGNVVLRLSEAHAPPAA
jgi:hypothetical protein